MPFVSLLNSWKMLSHCKFKLLYAFPFLPVCTTIGAYSKWIDTNQLNILPPLVDVLTKGMGYSEETAAAAAIAFKYICEGIYFA